MNYKLSILQNDYIILIDIWTDYGKKNEIYFTTRFSFRLVYNKI